MIGKYPAFSSRINCLSSSVGSGKMCIRDRYKMRLHDRAEAEHRDMVDRYRHRNDLTYGEARDMLAASGIFFDLNCDEFERDEITEQFVRLCNKT